MSKPIRITVYAPLGIGGVTSLMINIQELIDRNKINFDYLVIHDRKEISEDRVLSLGSRKLVGAADYVRNKYFRTIIRFFKIIKVCKDNDVKIFHYNGGAPYGLLIVIAAKFGGVKYVVFHSHNGGTVQTNITKNILNTLCKLFMPVFVDDYWACSSLAAEFSFPKRMLKHYHFIPNAIDLDRYDFNYSLRVSMRKELGIEDKFVVGHVGRLNKQKNHTFLIDIFCEIYKKNKNAILILCGVGELQEEIEQKILDCGIKDVTIFYGACNEMHKMYQVWDIFLMPSLFEGLPVSGVEAQASGLPVVFSDTITKEVAITDSVEYVSLDESVEVWADVALSYQGQKRKSGVQQLRGAGFDQKVVAENFQNYYLNISKGLNLESNEYE